MAARTDATSGPLVSVIMIFLDAQRFIAEAIESVLAQSYHRWELLLVDDGSRDGSTAVARRYAARHPQRIRYLEHPGHRNRGMAASRNLGMAEARGELIAFLDADDTFLPERLARHVALLAGFERPAMAISSDIYWHSWDAGARQHDRVVEIGVTPGVVHPAPRLLTLMLAPGYAASPGICSVTFHRLEADGLRGAPDEFVGYYEDQCLYGAVLAERPAIVTDEPLARYRQHDGAYTADCRDSADGSADFRARRRYLTWLRDHLAARGLLHGELAATLAACLAPHESSPPRPHRARTMLGRIARPFAPVVRSLPAGAERRLRKWLYRARETLRRRRIRRAERRGR